MTDSSARKRVAVVVPTFNGAAVLAELLDSLSRQTLAHQVVVVDNGSSDETKTMLATRFPKATVVALDENLGFGRAVNRGVAFTSADTVVFVNNDVVCESRFLEELVSALDPDARVVMAAGVLLQSRRPELIDTAGIVVDPTLLAFDYLHGEPVSVLGNGVHDPLGPCGGAAAFDRAAFDAAGGFDERFFAYFEDVDLAVRVASSGGRCRVARQARALHHHSNTLGDYSRRKNELVGWGRGYIIGKYRLHRRPGLFWRAVVGELFAAFGKLMVDRNEFGLLSRYRGWRDGLRADAGDVSSLPVDVADIGFVEATRRRVRRRLELHAGRSVSSSSA